MARSTSLFILFAALVIQAVLACSGITPGVYVIENEYAFLTTGPTPHVYPPIDVPARVLDTPAYGIQWLIEPVQGGYTIRASSKQPSYALIEKEGEPYFSAQKKAGTWAVNPAGDGLFTIGLPNEDRLLTADTVASLQPANGSPEQKWTLRRVDRYRNVYPNRFQHIL